jgi:pyrroloquinoline quinone biosynthesis protein B
MVKIEIFRDIRSGIWVLLLLGNALIVYSQDQVKDQKLSSMAENKQGTYLIVLGTVQDGGSPHIACLKACCTDLFKNPDPGRRVVSLGLIDMKVGKKYLFEATPDMTTQIKALKEFSLDGSSETPDGIFLTHAHIGHYTGLMYLGTEAMNADKVAVYAMPRMSSFLETNGPWSQLVANRNIVLNKIEDQKEVVLTGQLKVRPLKVPHRDEYSETAGYVISGPNKSALFIPDIDKWEKWKLDIIAEIKKVDYAFLDATFFDEKEINNRDISEIPHPFIIESMKKFEMITPEEKNKIIFIHFNHTNPVLRSESEASKTVLKNGFRIARIDDVFEL